MSEDGKLIIKVNLDEEDLNRQIEDLNKKYSSDINLDSSINLKNETINSLKISLDNLSISLDNIISNFMRLDSTFIKISNDQIKSINDFNQSSNAIADLNKSFEQGAKSSSKFYGSIDDNKLDVSSITDVLFKIDSLITILNNAPQSIENLSNFITNFQSNLSLSIKAIISFNDNLYYTIKILSMFTSFGNIPFFDKLPGAINLVNNSLKSFDSILDKQIEKTKLLTNLAQTASNISNSFINVISIIKNAFVTILQVAVTSMGVVIAKMAFAGFQAVYQFKGKIDSISMAVAIFKKGFISEFGVISNYLKSTFLPIFKSIFDALKIEFTSFITSAKTFFKLLIDNSGASVQFLSYLLTALFKDSNKIIKNLFGLFANRGAINTFSDLNFKINETEESLTLLSLATNAFGTEFTNKLSMIFTYSNLALTVFAFGFQYLLIKMSSYIQDFGASLAKHFTEAYNKFIEFRRESIAFVSTIQSFNRISKDAVGSTSEWSSSITKLSTKLNLSVKDLRKASAEIVAVGYRLGFTKEQMDQLLEVVSGYSVIAGKDLYDTTVAFTSALQGQSQAVQSYGVKLTEASNAHYSLMHGMKKSFTQMSDSEKYQVRLNNLISQYGVVSGVASDISNDWFANSKKLGTTLENVTIKLGEGAVVIEDFNLFALIANKFLGMFSDGILKSFGFIGAFSSRVIQLTGFILNLSLKFGILAASIKFVDMYLKSNTWSVLATKTIPFLNLNLKTLANNISGTGRELNSVKNIALTLADALMKNKAAIFGFLFGIGGIASIGGLLTGIFSKLSAFSLVVLATFGKIALALVPITLTLSIVYSLFVLFKEAITLIDAKTGIFTDTIDSLKSSFQELTGYVMESKSVFTELGKIVSHVTGTILGGFTHDLNTGILAALKSYRLLAGAFISDKSKQALDEKIFKLSDFNKKLELAGMNANKLAQELNQASKATFEKPKENLEELMNQLKEAAEFIKSGPKKIAEELKNRLALVKQNLAAEVISEKQAQEQIAIFRTATAKKVKEALDQINTDSILSPEEKASKDYQKSMKALDDIYKMDLINFATYNEKKWEIAQVYGNEIHKIIEEEKQKELDKMKQTKENAYSMVDVAKATVGAITNIIAGSFERLGAQLINGGSAWSDYTAFVLDIIANLMIQVGTAVIGMAVALQSLQAAIATWQWPLALAAGIALVVAGGALKAIAGNSKSSTGYQPTSSMAGGTSTGSYYNPIEPKEIAPKGKEQSVVINIEGSLISTEQTSRTLIDMIAKEFDKSGAQIRTRAFA